MKSKILTKIICKVFGHIYPLKKLSTPDYLKYIYLVEGEGAYIADTSKPCHRCGEQK